MRPIQTAIILAAVSLLVTSGHSAADASSDVPLSHPIYDAMDRAEARGLTESLLPGARPYSESDLFRLSTGLLRDDRLSKAERGTFRRYLEETSDSGDHGGLLAGKFYGFTDDVLRIRANPLLRQSVHLIDDTSDAQVVSQTYIGIAVSGTFYDHFSFRVQHFEAREWSDLARSSRSEVWATPIETVQLKGKSVDFRESRHQFRITMPWFEADIGKQSFAWGPSREANVFLDASAPSLVYARLNLQHKSLSFRHIFGVLRTPPGDPRFGTVTTSNGHTRRILPAKRLVAHRLELALSKHLQVGIQESAVYGDRGFEPAYAAPFAVLVGAQSLAGDSDNIAFGMDVAYRPKNGIRLYLAAFLDDLSKLNPGSFSNQVGIQAGAFWADPFRLPDTDLQFEYVRIEPYAYAHNFDINAYTHYGAPLGHPLGPNADRFSVKARWLLMDWVKLQVGFERSREAENYVEDAELVNVGGDANLGRRPNDKPERVFLAGDRLTTRQISLVASVEPAPALRFRLAYMGRRETIAPFSTPGQSSQSTHILSMSTELNAF